MPLGDSGEVEPPVTISNTEVKRLSADDTVTATFWENKSLPGGILLIFYLFCYKYVFINIIE